MFDPRDHHTHNGDTLYDIATEAHDNAVKKGFWGEDRPTRRIDNVCIAAALMHSEVSEWVEAERKPGQSEHIPEFTAAEEEMADVLIRWCDNAKAMFDFNRVVEAVYAKMEYNRSRPYKHGKEC